ncbi:putative NBD/HSP70 family sugar kinase [Allocatelliglobosispora scoriae]|uniref:Putative NBD/HSP70 family sugar kinase n=1 Tax=Allocatelliglobosispora scoriae TaxID=643052 RepID=A0A841C2H2_9ACTN|nr:ROK family transcriptional regulator [Allocatelliglobosispora scoriae]MBB5874554.1 putative NBD/HSP70 family sugar kinase [Allocatelliglobosispora scoriae]
MVLDVIQLADGISRVELAQHTGLTAQTVSGIVRRLIDEGVVREDGASRIATGGKPRTILRVNADAGSAVGLHFDPVELTCVVVDLLGRALVTTRRPLPQTAEPDEVIRAMAELVEAVLAVAGVSRQRVLGLGVATPGPIDQDLGLVISPPQLAKWRRVAMKELLEAATGLAVTIDNDATAAAIGERWAGAGRGVANFAYFFLGTGIGGGLFLGHQVHRGGSLNAAEFGHITIMADGPECYCGSRGCVERLINPKAIVADARERLAGAGGGGSGPLAQRFRRDPATVDYEAVCDAAEAGDEVATAVVRTAADRLAWAVVNVANTVDVDLVILGGNGIRSVGTAYRDAVAAALATRPMARQIRVVDVVLSPLGADAAVVGAASLVLHSTFSPQVTSLLAE